MATIMAMIAPMKIVPQNNGTEPSDSPGAAGSMLCGLQCVPNRKSIGLTRAKKRRLSNSSDATMPTVVRIAIREASSRPIITSRSTRVRARNSGLSRVQPNAPPAKASNTAAAMPIVR